MKKVIKKPGRFFIAITCSLFALLIISSCKKDKNTVSGQSFTEVNLVASVNTVGAARVDPGLINGWGIAFGSSGTAWISAEGGGVSVVYDQTGAQVLPAVSI